jgi:endonuclease/exonuclease/phosphatase (EEP) superfamily protein YafD
MRILGIILAITAVTGCITNDYSDTLAAGYVPTEPESCADRLSDRKQARIHELNSSEINLVNWNIQKGGDPEWTKDLKSLSGGADLLVFQEAAVESSVWDTVGDGHYQSFAPGFRTLRSMTGVMTLSAVEPLAQCNLLSHEPWLGSAKATVITEYGLTETDRTLLVVNIHAINFTFGIRDFEEQIQGALDSISAHTGPVLLSGDFNTWHLGRMEKLQKMLSPRGFIALEYDEDHRKRAFGQPLDHIYVRGLQAIEATTQRVATSDHNPMSVRLRLHTDNELSLPYTLGAGGS